LVLFFPLLFLRLFRSPGKVGKRRETNGKRQDLRRLTSVLFSSQKKGWIRDREDVEWKVIALHSCNPPERQKKSLMESWWITGMCAQLLYDSQLLVFLSYPG
jgi:hypothetical protein